MLDKAGSTWSKLDLFHVKGLEELDGQQIQANQQGKTGSAHGFSWKVRVAGLGNCLKFLLKWLVNGNDVNTLRLQGFAKVAFGTSTLAQKEGLVYLRQARVEEKSSDPEAYKKSGTRRAAGAVFGWIKDVASEARGLASALNDGPQAKGHDDLDHIRDSMQDRADDD
jgi:hypothetical protein